MLLNAVTYAMAARALSHADMGMWALATALTTIALSLDLGLASHLRNRLAAAGQDAERKFVDVFNLSAIVATAYLGTILLAWGAFEAWHASGPSGLTPAQRTLATAMMIGFVLLLARMPFNIAASAFYSFHEPDFPILWEVFNFATSFALVALALWLRMGVVVAAGAFIAGGTLTAICCMLHFLRRRGWRLQLRLPAHAAGWLRDSRAFGLLQIIALGLSTMPSFTIGSLVRVEEVTVARAAMILCQAILSLHLAHAMPLWTEFTLIRECNDRAARAAALRRRLVRESALLLLCFTTLAVCLPWAVSVWLNRAVDFRVTTVFCAWGLACGIGNLHSLILNGANLPMQTAAATVPGTVIAAFLAWLLAPSLGSPGVGAAFAIGAASTTLLMVAFARRQISSLQERRPSPVMETMS